MKQFIIPIVSGMIGVIIPVAGMTITPTRDLILGLAPDEAVLQLADKIDESRIINEGKMQEMQKTIEDQQIKINEQEDGMEEFKGGKNEENEKNNQTVLVNQKSLACSEANRIQSEIKDNCGTMPYPGMEKCIKSLKERYDDFKRGDNMQSKEANEEDAKRIKKKLEKVEALKPAYLEASKKCGIEAR